MVCWWHPGPSIIPNLTRANGILSISLSAHKSNHLLHHHSVNFIHIFHFHHFMFFAIITFHSNSLLCLGLIQI
ncbi:hypothetical protein VIGAN_01473700 [Vigna angularis var. angularis]|uniref:Uncharacterized protein n=1 Tax=Vigna angularis var. angularis TaxID=157739 RepID=A0A0S3R816_PHAAN|nr:hypothetical protein VIGAN_01473700 [Vigna angularis var. angularis]